MKLDWQLQKWNEAWSVYDARMPDGAYITLSSFGTGWYLVLRNCHGQGYDTLMLLDAGAIRLNPEGQPIGGDPEVFAWLAPHFPLVALAALAQETT